MNKLYFGDNLDILREHIKDESVDLIYLDPPFNSNANYNVLFKTPKGHESAAQIEAFEDTWHWNEQANREFHELVHCGNTDVSEMVQALRRFLGENDMMAYLTMMANRLIELHRVLKPTGSLYLHCDPTASHYLKIVLDGVFGQENFRSEIIWRRTNSHNSTTMQFGAIHDVILFFTKSNEFTFHPKTRPYSKSYIEDRFKYSDERGRYQTNYLTGPGVRYGESGREWRGFNPTSAKRHWAIPKSLRGFLKNDGKGMSSHQQLEVLFEQDLIIFPKKDGGQPMYKQYIGDGLAYQDLWTYQPNTNGVLHNSDECIDEDVKYLEDEKEKLGYPTQKPVGLLARIIETSCDEGDLVLDPFCGCGTAVHAAQKLKRQWLGIDITHLAVSLIEKRMKDAFPGIVFEVEGTPKDLEGAQNLALRDKYQFQWWACSLVGAQPFQGKKKGADGGIDGLIYFNDDGKMPKKIIVSVKGGENVSVAMVRDLAHVVEREKAEIGLFVTLADSTAPMRTEAVKTGYYTSPITGASFAKIQILTIEGLMESKERAQYPDLSAGGVTFKKAKVEEKVSEQKGLF